MTDVPTLVLDASVAAKWHLLDEDLLEEAMALRADYGQGRISVAMPDFARYEVANIFSVARQRGRLNATAARRAVADFQALGFTFLATQELILDAMGAVERFGCAFYDGLYVALAEQLGTALVTADERLMHRVQGKAPYVKWLGDYGNR